MPFVQVSARPVIESDVTLGQGVTRISAGASSGPNFTTTHRCLTGDMLVMGAYRTNAAGTPSPAIGYTRDSNAAEVPLSRHVHGVQGGAAGRCGVFIATGRSVPTDAPDRFVIDFGASVSDIVLRSCDLVGWGGLVGSAAVNAYTGAAVQQLATSAEMLGHGSLLVAVAAGVRADLDPVTATNFTLIDQADTGTASPGDVSCAFFQGVGGEAGALERFLAEFAASHTELAVAMCEIR